MLTIKSACKIVLMCLASFFTLSPAAAAETKDTKTVYGLHEKIFIYELGVQLPAKLDTGATTSSLSARNIRLFDKDGQQWVSFQLAVADAPPVDWQLPVVRTSRIKRRADDLQDPQQSVYSKRPVVMLNMVMGDQQVTTEANLTDRSHFDFPLLLGAGSLEQFQALVDVSKTYLAGEPQAQTD